MAHQLNPPPEIKETNPDSKETASAGDNSHAEYLPELSPSEQKKLLRKMDLQIMPMLTTLYLFAFLDRGNIGNAKIEGLIEDLNMTGSEFNLCLSAFFFTYAAFELPSNLILKRLRPSIWLPALMIAWGTVMTLMGIVQNYHGLLVARIFLGITEAGLYPGVAFYITMWYCRHEALFRQALFFSAASVAGAFSGLLAFGIAKMDGVGGYEGWRWIFILEGIATVLVACVAYFLIHDSPETANFLSDEERQWVIYRLRHQYSTGEGQFSNNEKFKWKYVKDALIDWQVYAAIIVFYGIVCPLYGISFFLPTIIKDLGYTSSTAQLLTIPIYITAAVLSVLAAAVSDRLGQRSPLLFIHMACIIVGFVIVLAASGRGVPGVVYFGIFLAVAGIYPALPANVTWLSNNLTGSYKRAAGMAMHIGMGNFAGAMAANFYRSQDSPKFILGHSLELGFAVAGLIGVFVLRVSYSLINKKRDEMMAEHPVELTPAQEDELGDRAPQFRYML
ncbi:major facilitator superfamily domain-containing protein [Aspergillus pseudodeflectus]|uniref:Major facilitator superfamily domain-containing protein n=1 Tax=Aspergillus pseudodeflectus TaxID=176178 RepID=A0ABR4KIX3_9EURO